MLGMNEQGPDEGLPKQVNATLSCTFLQGRYWVMDASMQAMQGRRNLCNKGLGWEGENFAIEAIGVKPAKTAI